MAPNVGGHTSPSKHSDFKEEVQVMLTVRRTLKDFKGATKEGARVGFSEQNEHLATPSRKGDFGLIDARN